VINENGRRAQSKERDFGSRLGLTLAPLKNCWLSKSYFRHLWIASVCATLLLPAVAAQAQQFSATDFTPKVFHTTTGWWHPDRTGSTAVAPHLQVGISKLNRFEASETVLQPKLERTGYSIATPSDFEVKPDTPTQEFSYLAEAELLPSPSFLEAKYLKWESSLADSRSPTNVHGVLVYPLVQINYAQGSLPISLYLPPLRGSDAR
jgi:hypothetical protein